MFIDLVKFVHIIIALSLLGMVGFTWSQPGTLRIVTLQKILLPLVILAMITGSLLVYPKHFDFHTPWIQAAFLLCSVFAIFVLCMRYVIKDPQKIWLWRLSFGGLIVILVAIIHDAVTKTSLIY